MMDVKAIKGLLFGAVALLFAAIVFMLIQLVQGPGGLQVPQGSMSERAPEGAVAFLHLDVAGMLDTPLAREMAREQDQEKQLEETLEQLRSVDAFVLEPEAGFGPGKVPDACAVVRMGPAARKEFLELAADEGERVKAGSAYAFRVSLQQTGPLGFALPDRGGPVGRLFVAPAGSDAVAVATTSRAFGALADALAAVAPASGTQALADMARAARGDSLVVAIDGPKLMSAAPDEMAEAPEIVKRMQGALLSLAVTEDLRLRGMLRLASSTDAAEALAKAQDAVAKVQADLEGEQPPPGLPVAATAAVLNRLSLSASGPDVEAVMVLTPEDLQQMVGLVLMTALAGSMQGQGMGPRSLPAPDMN